MSFKKNIIANYVSQIYMSLAGILVLPIYLQYMGAEAYGLVGFFSLLQSWFSIIDLGLTPTMARETARLQGGATNPLTYHKILRILQLIFIVIGCLGACFFLFFAEIISQHWLKAEYLSINQITTSIQLMGIIVALRWVSSLYRAIITGTEEFIWLSYYNFIITSFRYLGILPFLIYINSSPITFFIYQLLLSFFELLILAHKALKNLPILSPNQEIPWSLPILFNAIKPLLPLSLNVALSSVIWILITQTDKLILSKSLTLTEFSYFSIAVLAAGAVLVLSVPISTALIPRLAKIKASNDQINFIKIYRQATILVANVVVPISLILSLFPREILWVWTGDTNAADQAAPILRLYALGNGILALTSFPYYLQYAYGELKLHVLGNIIFVLVLIPLIIWSSLNYGMIGAGWVWFLANIAFFVIWTAIVHSYFIKNLHFHWVTKDIVPVIISSLLIVLPLKYYVTFPSVKIYLILQIGALSLMAFIFNGILVKLRFLQFPKKQMINEGF